MSAVGFFRARGSTGNFATSCVLAFEGALPLDFKQDWSNTFGYNAHALNIGVRETADRPMTRKHDADAHLAKDTVKSAANRFATRIAEVAG